MWVVVMTDEVTNENKAIYYDKFLKAYSETMEAKENLPSSVSFVIHKIDYTRKFNINGEYTL